MSISTGTFNTLYRQFTVCSLIDVPSSLPDIYIIIINSMPRVWSCKFQLHCSKRLSCQTFKAIRLEIYWEKSFQIVVLFSRIIVLDNAVVAQKIAKVIFYISQSGITPKTQVYQSHCDHGLYPFKHVQTL